MYVVIGFTIMMICIIPFYVKIKKKYPRWNFISNGVVFLFSLDEYFADIFKLLKYSHASMQPAWKLRDTIYRKH